MKLILKQMTSLYRQLNGKHTAVGGRILIKDK
jgi:hypothetical protein